MSDTHLHSSVKKWFENEVMLETVDSRAKDKRYATTLFTHDK
jgi:hypothetical protein